MSRNLITDPNGYDNFCGWKLTRKGGDGWIIEDMPGGCGHPFPNNAVTKYFATSFELCLKRQLIDLIDEGYTPQQLDAQPPVNVEDWYSGRTDCGCQYEITVRLLDKDHRIMKEFRQDPVNVLAEASSWKKITYKFSNYGPGLRFISFEHGGKDTKFWKGFYGVRVTGSSVTLQI